MQKEQTTIQPGTVRYSWEWPLDAPPEALWPLVSDTNRANYLAKQAPVSFVEVPAKKGPARRVGRSRMVGMAVEWDEHPFEWVTNERLSVQRTFRNGPLSAYRSTVTLEVSGTGTLLKHVVVLTPRFRWLAPIVKMQERGLFRNWTFAYKTIEKLVRSGEAAEDETAGQVPAAIEAACRLLLEDGFDPVMVDRLGRLVAQAPDLDLQQIRPFALADRWNAPRQATLELCLKAAAHHLLEPRWSLLCPHCRGPKVTVDRLSKLASTAHCTSCNVDFTGQFDKSAEITFRPNPRIREVLETVFCVGGPGATPHVVFQGRIGPGERLTVNLSVPAGVYTIRGAVDAVLTYEPGGATLESQEFRLAAGDDTLGAATLEPLEAALGGPRLTFGVSSHLSTEAQVVVSTSSWAEDVVTAAYLVTRGDLSGIFVAECPAPSVELPVALLGFLCVRLHEAWKAYETKGDTAARLAQGGALAWVNEVVIRHRGGVVRTDAEGLMAAFFDPLDAVTAAVALRDALAEKPALPRLRLGVDAGPAVAFNDDDRLGYYGAAASRASEAERQSDGADVILSTDLAADIGVEMWLAGRTDKPVELLGKDFARLRGL